MKKTSGNVSSKAVSRIRSLRMEAGYKTTKAFCDACHAVTRAQGNECSLTIGTIGNYERGTHPISRESAEIFAKVLKVRPDYILGISDKKTEQEVLTNFYSAIYAKDSGILATLEISGYHLHAIYDRGTGHFIRDLIPLNPSWMDDKHLFIFSKDTKENVVISGYEWLRFQQNIEAIVKALFERIEQPVIPDVPPAATN